ncbi:unnamed protein product [Bemisia tabaci]|uniref:Uncharacterized protein n=1 Tax=Bemisia tabaci TaxID=7038 RepID=A0A9P0EYN2_BEMTA|nr:unnamed protein product [Bemisia tabaci]
MRHDDDSTNMPIPPHANEPRTQRFGAVHARDFRTPNCIGYGNGTHTTALSINLFAQPGSQEYCGVLVNNLDNGHLRRKMRGPTSAVANDRAAGHRSPVKLSNHSTCSVVEFEDVEELEKEETEESGEEEAEQLEEEEGEEEEEEEEYKKVKEGVEKNKKKREKNKKEEENKGREEKREKERKETNRKKVRRRENKRRLMLNSPGSGNDFCYLPFPNDEERDDLSQRMGFMAGMRDGDKFFAVISNELSSIFFIPGAVSIFRRWNGVATL